MRKLASYSLEARLSQARAAHVLKEIQAWLASKGDIADDGGTITLRDGRIATIERTTVQSSRGQLTEIALTEPRPDGFFRTFIRVAEAEDTVAVAIDLSAATEAFAPVFVDVRCPRIVREILSPPSQWTYRGTKVSSAPVVLRGVAGGDELILLAWDADRSIPIVCVSDDSGLVLHPGIVEDLARDLAVMSTDICPANMHRREGGAAS